MGGGGWAGMEGSRRRFWVSVSGCEGGRLDMAERSKMPGRGVAGGRLSGEVVCTRRHCSERRRITST